MPYGLSRAVQVGLPVRTFRTAAELATSLPAEERIGSSLVVREPVGVVAAITPWNYPLHQIVAKVAPALAAGCTVVLKPSEVAPLNAFILAEIIDGLGLPAGVFNLVSGVGPVVGEAIATHPDVDMISFTGSTRAGTRVAELAAPTVKRVALELGGKSANIILDDLEGDELDTAVRKGVGSAYLNSGQTCTAFTRMLVPAAKHDQIVDIIRDEVENVYTIGDPAANGGRLGPLISDAQRARVRSYIEKGVEEGAQLVVGGADQPEDLPTGYYVKPTVFAGVDNGMTIAQEEIFGPVLSVIPYEDVDDAVRIANDTPYGLSGGVWGADKEKAQAVARRMRTGQVEVNGGGFNPLAPFGGYKMSGIGRELGKYGLEEFLQVKAMQR
jgi:acyl-CoA reductase-like NAD-dependent aldehyde dehydrogenase